MNIVSPGRTKMFFRKVALPDGGKISLNADMIRLLMAIDENKDLSRISNEIGMDTSVLNETLSRLLKLKLIESVEKKAQFLNNKFIESLRTNLSQAVGPMAQIIIEDTVADMGLKMSEIPEHQAAELISNIAQEVPEENNQIEFKKTMIEIMKKNRL